MTDRSGPYAFHLHLISLTILIVAVAAVIVGHKRLVAHDQARATRWERRQKISFATAVVAAALALNWPLADLAAHWSLTALVTQRLLLVLAVPPFTLLGLPYDVLQWATKPAPIDTALAWFRRPIIAIVTFTVIAVGSMSTGLVSAQSSSVLARGLLDALLLLAGLILWLPVLGRVPGIQRLQPVGRFTYLVAQAIVPAFLSFIYIFAKHPFYDVFSGSHRAIGLRPLTDQQIAGFVSKLSMLFVMLTVGAVVLSRAHQFSEGFGEDEPLVWADVERHFERADRRTGGPRLEPDLPSSFRSPLPDSLSDPGVGEPERQMGEDERGE